MAARLAVFCFLTACTVALSVAIAEDEPVVSGMRDQLRASIGPGYEHVRTIQRPTRRVAAEQLGNPNLAKPGAMISVIGTLSDQQIRAILELVGEDVLETTKVTGDQKFAVVQLGDPQRDPCCTTTVLFENKEGIWTNLGAITQSH
jgi:hypothetical protein